MRSAGAAPQVAAPRERRDGDHFQRGRDRADSHAQRARVTDHAAPRREREPPPRRSGSRASRRLERVGTAERATRNAGAAPRAAAPRERRDGDRFQGGRNRADSHAQRARVADHVAPRQEPEPPTRRGGGRAPRRREQDGMTERAMRRTSAAPQAAAPRERRDGVRFQRGRPRAESARRRPRRTTHHAKSAKRRREGAAAERHAAASAAARLSGCQGTSARRRRQRRRERGATASASREDSHALKARAADHAAPCQEREPQVTPPGLESLLASDQLNDKRNTTSSHRGDDNNANTGGTVGAMTGTTPRRCHVRDENGDDDTHLRTRAARCVHSHRPTPPRDLGNGLSDTLTAGGSQPIRLRKDAGRQPGGARGWAYVPWAWD